MSTIILATIETRMEIAWAKHCGFKARQGHESVTLRNGYNRLARLARYLRERVAR